MDRGRISTYEVDYWVNTVSLYIVDVQNLTSTVVPLTRKRETPVERLTFVTVEVLNTPGHVLLLHSEEQVFRPFFKVISLIYHSEEGQKET